MANQLRAEVISIGDEMTSGQRLDTNTQWLSQQLGELGVEVAFHSTVGDNLADKIDVFRVASRRADIVVCTGGLGPTSDDLTREVLANLAKVELDYHPEVVEHIRKIYSRHSREMPERNRVQAYFPKGSTIIDNPEGTAPGIDMEHRDPIGSKCRFFALPGVPAEMKQMWNATVGPAIRTMTGDQRLYHHHVIHCFGTGESQTEEMLPDLIRRGRDPRVGITASNATISLRISTRGETIEQCDSKMRPTINQIKQIMGEHVFGENGETLQEVVVRLLNERTQSLAIADLGLGGEVAVCLDQCPTNRATLAGALVCTPGSVARMIEGQQEKSDARTNADQPGYSLNNLAEYVRNHFQADFGIAIGEIEFPKNDNSHGMYKVFISSRSQSLEKEFRFGGHSSLRRPRSVKQVLNAFRCFLQAD